MVDLLFFNERGKLDGTVVEGLAARGAVPRMPMVPTGEDGAAHRNRTCDHVGRSPSVTIATEHRHESHLGFP